MNQTVSTACAKLTSEEIHIAIIFGDLLPSVQGHVVPTYKCNLLRVFEVTSNILQN